ncbi:MAG: SsrA-binding protein SmpB [Verrucomicrobiia bacterium]|jgi:SsrA-binding protein
MGDIVTNSKARRDYHILDVIEAGICLRGTEVKSLREGRGQINDAFARIENGEVFLYNSHIDEYSSGSWTNHDPKAPRKLLLKKSEIRKLQGFLSQKGHSLIPLSLYWKNGKVKVALALAKGKVEYDKRQDIRERETEKMLRRITMRKFKTG